LVVICTLACFFFQAEDGIRDFHVTGVQTCALPILTRAGPALVPALAARPPTRCPRAAAQIFTAPETTSTTPTASASRSNECRSQIGRASCREEWRTPRVQTDKKLKSKTHTKIMM